MANDKISLGALSIKSISFGSLPVEKLYFGTTQIYQSGPNIDPVLDNNDWATIKAICEAGLAADYWAIGDTKTDVGTDNISRSFRIVDMSGLYNKHVVFEQVGLDGTDGTAATGIAWNNSNSNNYSTASVNTTILPNIMLRYSNDLQNVLTNTTVQVAEKGNLTSLVNVTNKLFLIAEKEMKSTREYSVQQEFDVLTTFAYYVINTASSAKVKYNNQSSTKNSYWTRSPYSGSGDSICSVNTGGSINAIIYSSPRRYAPCFAF